MKGFRLTLPGTYAFLCVLTHLLHSPSSAKACTFPDYLQWQEGDDDFNWYTRVRNGRRREVAYSIRHNVIDVSQNASSLHLVRWKCAMTFHGKFLLKRRDPETSRHHSACVKFLHRSSSIVQVMSLSSSSSSSSSLSSSSVVIVVVVVVVGWW